VGNAKDDRKYSRVYHEAVDDPKFRDIWDNDARLALWLRLLVTADQAWPASATLPRSTRRSPLASLVECGLVDLVNGDRYRIHGLDPERQGRSDAAAYAAQSKWNAIRNAQRIADSIADGNAETMPRLEEKRRDKVAKAPVGTDGVVSRLGDPR
jgi:hypothetical protein